MKKTVSFFLFLVLLCNSALLLAQAEPESIVPETDKFQDYFYESLKQKGIENYDKAITALEYCLKLKPNDAVVYSEMGKNYFGLKNYEQSYSSYEKAAQIDPKNKWYWAGMYEVSYQTKNYNQAILSVNKLIEFDKIYQDDLVSLYMYTQQFDKALVLIEELNEKVGKSDRREMYKTQILAQGKFQNAEVNILIEKINKNPKEESNYVALVKLYSENNEAQKASEITKKLELEIPDSDWAQLGFFQFYLNQNEVQKAINAMNVVLASSQIEAKIKRRVLDEFLNFVNKKPQYSPDLEKAMAFFDKDPDVNVAKEIGKYYYSKKQWDKAISYYELSLKNNSGSDIETNMLLLQSYVETKQFEMVSKKSTSLVEIYPTQPQFYYFSGLANNQLKQFKKAIDMLEMGMDYVVDDLQLEINFNLQLGEAFNGLGDFKKKEQYFTKANQLLKAKK
ncbi:cytochrome C biosynthesis protein [Flavobacterium franklandianum]|uniref:tetratricopeptide repeat protein n=1 Tax=Flavobacterium franklandianum TaxID=2594430 RepID=UPI00117AB2EA|nr:cytochrome C biosynthesis protein [Flavobacterium franklandianum]TRX24519.1 cytochrome C biosynthesis protein [Flavobacterium franklandianum]